MLVAEQPVLLGHAADNEVPDPHRARPPSRKCRGHDEPELREAVDGIQTGFRHLVLLDKKLERSLRKQRTRLVGMILHRANEDIFENSKVGLTRSLARRKLSSFFKDADEDPEAVELSAEDKALLQELLAETPSWEWAPCQIPPTPSRSSFRRELSLGSLYSTVESFVMGSPCSVIEDWSHPGRTTPLNWKRSRKARTHSKDSVASTETRAHHTPSPSPEPAGAKAFQWPEKCSPLELFGPDAPTEPVQRPMGESASPPGSKLKLLAEEAEIEPVLEFCPAPAPRQQHESRRSVHTVVVPCRDEEDEHKPTLHVPPPQLRATHHRISDPGVAGSPVVALRRAWGSAGSLPGLLSRDPPGRVEEGSKVPVASRRPKAQAVKSPGGNSPSTQSQGSGRCVRASSSAQALRPSSAQASRLTAQRSLTKIWAP